MVFQSIKYCLVDLFMVCLLLPLICGCDIAEAQQPHPRPANPMSSVSKGAGGPARSTDSAADSTDAAATLWSLLGFSEGHGQRLGTLSKENWEQFERDSGISAASLTTLKLLRDYFSTQDDARQSEIMAQLEQLARSGVAEAQYLMARKLYEESAVEELAAEPQDLSETDSLIQAAMWLNAAADVQFPPALRNLGDAFWHGWGMPPEPEMAQDLYLRAAELGDPSAVLKLMDLCNRELLEPLEPAVMAWLLEETHEHFANPIVGYFAARQELVEFLEQAQSESLRPGAADSQAAEQAAPLPAAVIEKIKTAANQGYAPACFHYYFLLTAEATDSVPTAEARKHLEQAAAAGLLAAQLELASLLEQQLSTQPEHLDEIERWLRQAAIQDPVDAQVVLGQFEEIHRQDPLEAYVHYLDSAMRGGRSARFHLGRLLLEQPDPFAEILGNPAAEGLFQIRNAAERDEPDACYYLADYQLQRLEEMGIAEPLRWLRKAAEQDHVEAQARLGQIYWHGTGMSRPNPVVAIRWLAAAAAQGELESLKLLEKAYREGIGTIADSVLADEISKMLEESADEQ